MAAAAGEAASSENKAAGFDDITGGIKIAAGLAMLPVAYTRKKDPAVAGSNASNTGSVSIVPPLS
jgi:hypothetical protein